MTRIIAIDPGSNQAGYAVMDGIDTLLDSGTIKAKRSLDFYDRVKHIAQALSKFADKFGCEVMVIEDQHSSPQNRRSGLQVAKASGYIVGIVGLPVVEIVPSQAKSYATGNGNACKDLVRSCIINRFPDTLKGIVVTFDEADSVAIGIAYYAEEESYNVLR